MRTGPISLLVFIRARKRNDKEKRPEKEDQAEKRNRSKFLGHAGSLQAQMATARDGQQQPIAGSSAPKPHGPITPPFLRRCPCRSEESGSPDASSAQTVPPSHNGSAASAPPRPTAQTRRGALAPRRTGGARSAAHTRTRTGARLKRLCLVACGQRPPPLPLPNGRVPDRPLHTPSRWPRHTTQRTNLYMRARAARQSRHLSPSSALEAPRAGGGQAHHRHGASPPTATPSALAATSRPPAWATRAARIGPRWPSTTHKFGRQ